MTRPILTLKKPVVQKEQTEPTTKTDSLVEPTVEKTEEQKKDSGNKAPKERAPTPPLVLKLCEQFPNLFNLKFRKPLKVDIEEDILQALAEDTSVTTNDLYNALCYYLNSTAYLKGLEKNDHRFDLNGEVCGLVSDLYSLEVHCKKTERPRLRKPLPTPPLVLKLCERFPNTFSMTDRKPLKVGISKEIIHIMRGEGAGSGLALRGAIHWYTSRVVYYLAVIAHTHRVDLEGNAVEEVKIDQKVHSALAIEEIKSFRNERDLSFQNKKKDPGEKDRAAQTEEAVIKTGL